MANPLVGSGSEGQRLGQICLPLSFKMIGEERRKNLPPVIFRGETAEFDTAELLSFPAAPAAVIPGTDDEKILVVGVVLFQQLSNLQGAVEILLIPPAGDIQGGDGDAIQPWSEALRFQNAS